MVNSDVVTYCHHPSPVSALSGRSEHGDATSAMQGEKSSSNPMLYFLVVGSSKAGKSVFIQRALDLKRSSSAITNCKKMSLEGQIFLINLVEMQLDEIGIGEDETICWPQIHAIERIPSVDGVLALYDVTERSSISLIPKFLSKCWSYYARQYQATFLYSDVVCLRTCTASTGCPDGKSKDLPLVVLRCLFQE